MTDATWVVSVTVGAPARTTDKGGRRVRRAAVVGGRPPPRRGVWISRIAALLFARWSQSIAAGFGLVIAPCALSLPELRAYALNAA